MGVVRQDFRLISDDGVQVLAVGGGNDGMRAVLTGRIAGIWFNQFVKLVVTIRIRSRKTPQPWCCYRNSPRRRDYQGKALVHDRSWKLGQFGVVVWIRTGDSSSSLGPDYGMGDLLDAARVSLFPKFGNGNDRSHRVDRKIKRPLSSWHMATHDP